MTFGAGRFGGHRFGATPDDSGGPPELAPYWTLEGERVMELMEEVRSWDSLELTFVCSKDVLRERFRPHFTSTGKVEIVPKLSGGFDAMDRTGQGNDNRLELYAPAERRDVRPMEFWLMDDYETSVMDKDAGTWEVVLELVPDRDKAFDSEYGTFSDPPHYPQPEGGWLFEFAYGDVATNRVSADLEQSPDGTFQKAELELILMSEEVRVIEESACWLDAVNYRDVHDGQDILEDTTHDNRNTVEVTPPAGAEDTMEPGAYIIDGWETTYQFGAYVMNLDLIQLA